MKIGMIGLSEGNGHPYSFSAIFNGFNEKLMKEAWPNIYKYLVKQDKKSFGIPNAKVTHIWTQDMSLSKKIAKASYIENIVLNFEDMLDSVDAVIIARDDYETHMKYSKIFLENCKYVFIDKPLSLEMKELEYFYPYLKSGQLMSCSSMRYAPELDMIKIEKTNNFKLIRGTVAKDWEKYAIHILEGIYSIIEFDIESVYANESQFESVTIYRKNNMILSIDALNGGPSMIKFDFFTEIDYFEANTLNAFVAFKRTMEAFIDMSNTNIQPIEPELTINLMKVIKAQKKSVIEKRKVYLSEII